MEALRVWQKLKGILQKYKSQRTIVSLERLQHIIDNSKLFWVFLAFFVFGFALKQHFSHLNRKISIKYLINKKLKG